jgi:hypothetical protein
VPKEHGESEVLAEPRLEPGSFLMQVERVRPVRALHLQDHSLRREVKGRPKQVDPGGPLAVDDLAIGVDEAELAIVLQRTTRREYHLREDEAFQGFDREDGDSRKMRHDRRHVSGSDAGPPGLTPTCRTAMPPVSNR